MKRTPGYYWVRGRTLGWIIAQWVVEDQDSFWLIFDNPNWFNDHNWLEIHPTPIQPPL